MQAGQQTEFDPPGAFSLDMETSRPALRIPGINPFDFKFNTKIQKRRPTLEQNGILMDTLLGSVDKGRWEHSQLDRLPLELRHQIYGYVLGNGQEIRIQFVNPEAFKVSTYSPTAYLFFGYHRAALLRTCRQICAETVDLLYQTNTFIFSSLWEFQTFANIVNSQQLDQIRHIGLRLSSPESQDHLNRLNRLEWQPLLSAVTSIRHLRIVTFDIGHWSLYTPKRYLHLLESLTLLYNSNGLEKKSGLDFRMQVDGGCPIRYKQFLEMLSKMKLVPW
ncbi:MAG: hypothetical protein Q9221_008458 [Calogaya cf. arnoldii]